MEDLSWTDAREIVDRGISLAADSGLAVAVAVLDGGRELKAFGRADRAMLVTIQLAAAKAYTSCSMNRPTADLAGRTWSGSDLFGLEAVHIPPLTAIGGGAPLRHADELVGAIGVSGGTSAQDHELATQLADEYARQQTEAR